jgi:23S rRNA (uracil1939-C5)-methyltransferase
MNETIEIRIEKMVYGGDGLARLDGQAVFVPFTAPGDLVKARVTQRRKGYLRAEVVEILEPGPGRRDAPCPYFGTCGGCQLQHLTYKAQLEAKAAFLREALARIGHVDWDGEIRVAGGPEHEFGYRTRATAHIAEPGGRRIFGFFAPQSHRIVDVESCPLLTPELDAAWRSVRETEGSFSRLRDLELVAGDGDTAASPPVAPVGGRDLTVTAGGETYGFAPGVFFQVNRFALDALLAAALADAEGGALALDLYAGAGLFTVPLARRYRRVVAVEGEGRAASYARENCARNGVEGVEVVSAPVEEWLARDAVRLLDDREPDFVLLDPPRGGIGAKSAEALADLKPGRITYVSCDPATLARDLRQLLDRGYRLASLEAIDLFPQTFHVETVARLRREEL